MNYWKTTVFGGETIGQKVLFSFIALMALPMKSKKITRIFYTLWLPVPEANICRVLAECCGIQTEIYACGDHSIGGTIKEPITMD